ncbi:MAG TPA: WXG100 family type VII secretion target [Candidatus Janibacter merdipullorum]|nr:WXG100 family type VII secretion target [Candidatus Janibacter merdipullorum]
MGNLTDGMDIARVREVASQLKTEAGRIDEVNQNGTTQVGTLGENWLGNDSEQFASSWQDASKALQNASASLQTYSAEAEKQADQQEGASS